MNKITEFGEKGLAIYDKIEEIVDLSVKEGDPEKAFNAGKNLLTIEKLSSMGLAKLAYLLKGRWNEFDVPARFEDVAYIHWPEISKIHLERLIRSYEMLQSGDIPDELQKQFEQKGVKDLIVISGAWQSGYLDSETQDEWVKLADTDDDYDLREAVRELKGVEPRKHTLNLWMTRDGDLYCKVGSGENKHFGYLNLELKDDPEIEKAINRILNNARITAL